MNSSYNKSNPGVLEKGYLGGVMDDNKFYAPYN
jgi:hypothetical protein